MPSAHKRCQRREPPGRTYGSPKSDTNQPHGTSLTLAKVRQIKLNPDDPCPLCSSGLPLRQCCISSSGTLRIKSPELGPRPPLTGIACDGCYLSETNDCSQNLTGEHYVSKSILKQLDSISVSGVPWLETGIKKQVGINALTARILCGRHNSKLSVLDTDAGRFFEKLESVRLDISRRSLSTKITVAYFSGETLERWMLKVFCGIFFGKIAAAENGRLIDTHTINRKLLFRALLENIWEPECGLYIKGDRGDIMRLSRSVAIAPLMGAGTSVAAGIEMKFGGLGLRTFFDSSYSTTDMLRAQGWGHRMSELNFNIQRRRHVFALTWPPGTPPLAMNSEMFSSRRPPLD